MFKRITRKLTRLNDEAEQQIIMLRTIRSCGISISDRESRANIAYMFIKLMEMNEKPYYDGVIERLMLRNVQVD